MLSNYPDYAKDFIFKFNERIEPFFDTLESSDCSNYINILKLKRAIEQKQSDIKKIERGEETHEL